MLRFWPVHEATYSIGTETCRLLKSSATHFICLARGCTYTTLLKLPVLSHLVQLSGVYDQQIHQEE